MISIQPISNFHIIKLDPADTQASPGSKLLAPGAMLEKFQIPKRTGTVKATGRGLVTADGTIIPPQVKPGDRVHVLESKTEITVEHDGDKCIALSDDSHIIGIITGEESTSSLILGGK